MIGAWALGEQGRDEDQQPQANHGEEQQAGVFFHQAREESPGPGLDRGAVIRIFIRWPFHVISILDTHNADRRRLNRVMADFKMQLAEPVVFAGFGMG